MKKGKLAFLIVGIVFDIAITALLVVSLISENSELKEGTVAFGVLLAVFVVIEVAMFLLWDKIRNIDKQAKEKRAAGIKPVKKAKPPEREIDKVKVLGTRTGAETRVLATYNFTVYSLMIIYKDGGQEAVECTYNSKLFRKLLPYFDTENK